MTRHLLALLVACALLLGVVVTLEPTFAQYRIHLYAVPVCAPPVTVGSHALSVNPFAETTDASQK